MIITPGNFCLRYLPGRILKMATGSNGSLPWNPPLTQGLSASWKRLWPNTRWRIKSYRLVWQKVWTANVPNEEIDNEAANLLPLTLKEKNTFIQSIYRKWKSFANYVVLIFSICFPEKLLGKAKHDQGCLLYITPSAVNCQILSVRRKFRYFIQPYIHLCHIRYSLDNWYLFI